MALTSPVMRREFSREAREWISIHKRADAGTICSVVPAPLMVLPKCWIKHSFENLHAIENIPGMELHEDEQMATLDELFAFIDCCDDRGCSSESWSSGVLSPHYRTNKTLPAAHGSPSTVDKAMASSETSKPKRRRKRTGWSSSTGLQRRKRAELLFLRQHVKDLEAYADNLKNRVRPGAVKAKARCDWQQLAVVEHLERRKAEETNRVLRRILNNELQLSAALQLLADKNAFI